MALRGSLPTSCSAFCFRGIELPDPCRPSTASLANMGSCPRFSRAPRGRLVLAGRAQAQPNESKAVQLVLGGRLPGDYDSDSESSDDEEGGGEEARMTDAERRTLRRKIREMMDKVPETAELTDPEERKAKMRELMTKYELVVEEEDPNWPEDADDGMGFSLGQFFDNITIKPEKKDEEDDDEAEDRKEIVWEDDNYIKPIRDVKTKDWDASVFTDFGPMIVLVHNRYKRPKENEMARDELVKAIEMFWEHNLPSPRCVAVDACAEPDLVDALKVSGFPEVLFTNAGRIIHRDEVVRSADEWSRMMAFFYYKAARPPFLSEADGQGQEKSIAFALLRLCKCGNLFLRLGARASLAARQRTPARVDPAGASEHPWIRLGPGGSPSNPTAPTGNQRTNCLKRVKNDRINLLWKIRAQEPLPTNDMKKVESAVRNLISDELQKLKQSVEEKDDQEMDVQRLKQSLEGKEDQEMEVIWEYQEPQVAWPDDDNEDVLLEMERILYEDLREESIRKELEALDEEDAYLARAVLEHMQLNDAERFNGCYNRCQASGTAKVWCPVCKHGELRDTHNLIYCTSCVLRLDLGDDKITLEFLRERLANAHMEHFDRGCKAAPKFCLQTMFGLTALYIQCEECGTFEIVQSTAR
ncbi:hypothetical protein EJB05_53485 [Eragrostis curvula]|uniref:Thioredoxin domain-containing protein n=1 Tax=Eragrostis curvula TaxID=38414 RepID=A0A5J9SQ37_9POAL|nr:hypothetical protein EJB05_53485 [Eragrostis curvula]